MPRSLNSTQVKDWFKPQNKTPLPSNSSGYSCSQKVVFEGEEFDSNVSQLLDFNFLGGLEFIGCNFSNGLFFKTLKVRGGLKFDNCKSPTLPQIRPGLHFQDFDIDSLEITNCILSHGVYFEKPSSSNIKNLINTLSIKNGSFPVGGLNIVRTEIKSGFHLKGVSDCQNLIIKDCQIGKISDIDNFKTKQINIGGKDLVFKDNLNIWRVKGLDKLSITSGKFEGDIKIIKPIISDKMDFQNLEISKSLIIDYKDEQSENLPNYSFPEIYFKGCTVNEGFYLRGENTNCNKITIPFSPQIKGRLSFYGTNFKELHFSGTNSDNNISFNNCGFGKFHLNDFVNLKILSINGLNAAFQEDNNSEIQITDSNLGTWVLSNFNFKSFSKIIWKDSLVSDLKTSSIKWFEDNTLQIDGESDPNTCLRRRELYRQLKLASEKEGDRISALEFKSRELKAYFNALKVLNKKWWTIDRITLCLGLTNNHGQNWFLPLVLILAFTTFPFYPLILMAADSEISLCCLECDFISFKTFGNKFCNYGAVWPSLFNPARRISGLFPEAENSFALGFWDGLQRIVLAFFIFQIVSAFRKFVK
ncbi:MAG: hypothetical protein ACXIUD_06560 [Mongoliitalea sp.]